jgi:hypothetical protein
MSTNRFAAYAAFICFGILSTAALAEDRPYNDGPVVNVASIRTEYGKFDDYMKFLATSWKQQQENAKKAGLILDYKVYTVEARGADDADIYLVTTYKNWAALDGLVEKNDAMSKQVYGSTSASNAAAVDRGKMRRTLGSSTMQELVLK